MSDGEIKGTCTGPPTLLSVFRDSALHTPDNDFLVEDKDVYLSYNQSYILATQLIPARVQSLCPSLATSPTSKAILLSHNNALVPLAFLALWSMSVAVVPISTSAEPTLWAGMVRLIEPEVILVSPNLMKPLRQALEETGLDKKYREIVDLKSLIPPEFILPSEVSIRTSDFVPSCHRWLNSVYAETDALQRAVIESVTPAIEPGRQATTLFTSSAVDWATLKCVTYTHEMLLYSSARAMLMLGGLSYSCKPKRHLGWLPLSHCFEFCITFCGVVLRTHGAYLFFDRSLSSPSAPPSTPLPPLLLAGLAHHSPVTAFATVPAILTDIIQVCTQEDLNRLRALESLGVGGARTPESLFQWAASQDIAYFDCSGATEATGTICIRRARDPGQRRDGLQVIPGLMGVLEKTQSSDDFGELVIRGTYLPTGYDFRKSGAYHFDPVTGVTTYRTGDLYSQQEHLPALSYLVGEQVPEHDETREPLSGLRYIGRIDDVVTFSSGVKIDVLSLERLLDAHASIQRSALLGNIAGDALVALIQPRAANGITPSEQHDVVDAVLSLNRSLSFEKRLRRENIYIVRELPMTTKLTLNRKKVKKVLSEMTGDSDIPTFFPPPPSLVPSPPGFASKINGTAAPVIPLKQHTTIIPDVRRRVTELLARIFSVQEGHFSHPDATFVDIPLTSLASVRLAQALYDEFSVRVTGAQLYGIHNLADLCLMLESETQRSLEPTTLPSAMNFPDRYHDVRVNGVVNGIVRTPPRCDQDIAISGAACRFVGGIDSLESFWSALLSPDAFLKYLPHKRPSSRWAQPHAKEDMMYKSGWLDDVAIDNVSSFADFFGIPPHTAREMSPNARLVMQLGYEAIEDAGIAPRTLSGKNWGVFSSVNDSGWRERRVAELDLQQYALGLQGSADDAGPARLSYFLNLTGPALEIKTACSSSAVAIHQACLAIRNGDCDAAVVIAATTHLHPSGAIFRSQNGIVSASGTCAPFMDCANGFVASEGAAAIVLQKPCDARGMAYGAIRATCVGQNGTSRGFFAPNPKAQRRLLETALERAECLADDVSFLEAHGTGTQLGDAIESQVINETYGAKRTRPLYIGSSKAVVGHTEECAGMTGVLKTLLCLSNNAIPPQPRHGPLNKAIDTATNNAVIPTKITPFLPQTAPRLCAVSSFGISGTLAHIIIQDPQPEPPPHPFHASHHVFVLSARNPADYFACIRRFYEFFSGRHLQRDALEAACRTTQLGRDMFGIRRAWTVTGWKALLDDLHQALSQPAPRPFPLHYTPRLGIWFELPLSGRSPRVANDHELYHSKVTECREAGWAPEYEDFVVQLALAHCLEALGCNISIVGGEGMTEYVAAVFTGLIPPSSVFRLHGQTDRVPHRIVTVRCSRTMLDEYLTMWRADELRITGEHGADRFILRGTPDAVAALASEKGITVDLESTLPPPTILAPVVLSQPPRIPMVSSHLGEVIDDETVVNYDYWSNVQDRDMYTDTAWTAMASQCDVIVNLGLGGDICDVLKDKCVANHQHSLETLLGSLVEKGCVVDWQRFASKGPRAHLPPYSWATDGEHYAFKTSN